MASPSRRKREAIRTWTLSAQRAIDARGSRASIPGLKVRHRSSAFTRELQIIHGDPSARTKRRFRAAVAADKKRVFRIRAPTRSDSSVK